MDRKAWMVGVAGLAAVGVGAALYALLKEDDEEDDGGRGSSGKKQHTSSRQTTAEMRIDEKDAGLVIGRRGENIKDVERRTNTKINFKDELATEKERVLCIRGTAEDVQLAQILVHKTIASQPRSEVRHLEIKAKATGWIIGKGGETVRSLQGRTRCKIDVQRGADAGGMTRIMLKGTSDQVDHAERLILEKLRELDDMEKSIKTSVEARAPRVKYKPPLFLTSENGGSSDDLAAPAKKDPFEKLTQAAGEKSLGVFVSAISDPGRFYVQKVGPSSIALDKLVQEMTDHYRSEGNQRLHALNDVSEGDVVAAQWPGDDKWYRAKVVEVLRDEYDESRPPQVDIDFVDFGDCDKKEATEVLDLRTDFLRLSFQAIECCLAGVEPARAHSGDAADSSSSTGGWDDDAANDFERLTKCAQWKELQAEIVDYKRVDSNLIPTVRLVDGSGAEDVDIGLEMIRLGHAREARSKKDNEQNDDGGDSVRVATADDGESVDGESHND